MHSHYFNFLSSDRLYFWEIRLHFSCNRNTVQSYTQYGKAEMTELDNSDETRCSASEKSNAQKILQGLCHNTKQTRAIYWDTSGKEITLYVWGFMMPHDNAFCFHHHSLGSNCPSAHKVWRWMEVAYSYHFILFPLPFWYRTHYFAPKKNSSNHLLNRQTTCHLLL